jgi:hypothetical protein
VENCCCRAVIGGVDCSDAPVAAGDVDSGPIGVSVDRGLGDCLGVTVESVVGDVGGSGVGDLVSVGLPSGGPVVDVSTEVVIQDGGVSARYGFTLSM